MQKIDLAVWPRAELSRQMAVRRWACAWKSTTVLWTAGIWGSFTSTCSRPLMH